MINNPAREEICEILKEAGSIAVVGFSSDHSKVSRTIADYLMNKGYKVVGINPNFSGQSDIPVYSTLSDVPFQIDIVDVFMKSELIMKIIPEVLKIKPKVLWLQLGIKNNSAAKAASEKGITVIQDQCIAVNHRNCR